MSTAPIDNADKPTERLDRPADWMTPDLPCISEYDLFFPPDSTDRPPGVTDKTIAAKIEIAKDMCLDCPAMFTCLQAAKDRKELWGVWGGELFQNGVVLDKLPVRGRHAKDPSIAAVLAPVDEADVLFLFPGEETLAA